MLEGFEVLDFKLCNRVIEINQYWLIWYKKKDMFKRVEQDGGQFNKFISYNNLVFDNGIISMFGENYFF